MPKITKKTSESVCSGHPDKIADQISDAIVDEVLRQDPNGRTAVETLVARDRVILAGEVNTTAKVDFVAIAREQIKRLGYTDPSWGFHTDSVVDNYIHAQSPEISVGVDDFGAGDQGIIYGYATNETAKYLPTPIAIAHDLIKSIDTARESGVLPHLRPDGKAQVVVKYIDNKPIKVDHVTIAVPHDPRLSLAKIQEDLLKHVITPVLAEYGYSVPRNGLVINGTGVWHTPGPKSDAGLTGRKIVVDGYGGLAKVGGGAFSGKDPSKVDRSAAYGARYITKNIVAKGLADEVEIGLSYFIGAKEPVQFSIDTFGTNKVPTEKIRAFATKLLNPSVKNIVETLDLKRPIYLQTATYGHFGRPEFPWEEVKS